MGPPAQGSCDVESRIVQLVRHYELPESAVEKLALLTELLATDPLAPTAIRDPRRVVDEHLADALVALGIESVRKALLLADLGSGAGVPGLPLAIALMSATVMLVESNGRKCAFLERAVMECGLANTQVVNSRAESWHEGMGRVDVVTARALASPAVVAEYAAPLLRLGGTLVIWRGRRDPQAEIEGEAAGAELGLRPERPIAVAPYPGAIEKHLYLMSKVRYTPERFPRRPGVAAKRPLGAGRGAHRQRPSV